MYLNLICNNNYSIFYFIRTQLHKQQEQKKSVSDKIFYMFLLYHTLDFFRALVTNLTEVSQEMFSHKNMVLEIVLFGHLLSIKD